MEIQKDQQAGMCNMVEPPHLHFVRDDAPALRGGSRFTRLAYILLYSWRGDSLSCVDLIGVSTARSGWRDATSPLPSLEEGKREKHTATCKSHAFDLIPLGLSTFGSFGLAVEEVLSRICQRYS